MDCVLCLVPHLVDDLGGDELLPLELDGDCLRHVLDEDGEDGHNHEHAVLPDNETPHHVFPGPVPFRRREQNLLRGMFGEGGGGGVNEPKMCKESLAL